ncbi:hypothetical protein ACLOJK_010485 [Asimina triloba]
MTNFSTKLHSHFTRINKQPKLDTKILPRWSRSGGAGIEKGEAGRDNGEAVVVLELKKGEAGRGKERRGRKRERQGRTLMEDGGDARQWGALKLMDDKRTREGGGDKTELQGEEDDRGENEGEEHDERPDLAMTMRMASEEDDGRTTRGRIR